MYQKALDVGIATYMRANRMNQGQFAELVGMGESSLSKKRRGLRSFSIDEAVRIARVIGVSLDEVAECEPLPSNP